MKLSNLITYNQKILTLLPKFCRLVESHHCDLLQPNKPYVHHNAILFVTWIPKMMLWKKRLLLNISGIYSMTVYVKFLVCKFTGVRIQHEPLRLESFFVIPKVTKQRKELEKKNRLTADQVVQLSKVMVPLSMKQSIWMDLKPTVLGCPVGS